MKISNIQYEHQAFADLIVSPAYFIVVNSIEDEPVLPRKLYWTVWESFQDFLMKNVIQYIYEQN